MAGVRMGDTFASAGFTSAGFNGMAPSFGGASAGLIPIGRGAGLVAGGAGGDAPVAAAVGLPSGGSERRAGAGRGASGVSGANVPVGAVVQGSDASGLTSDERSRRDSDARGFASDERSR